MLKDSDPPMVLLHVEVSNQVIVRLSHEGWDPDSVEGDGWYTAKCNFKKELLFFWV
jgi:hypothetical protein